LILLGFWDFFFFTSETGLLAKMGQTRPEMVKSESQLGSQKKQALRTARAIFYIMFVSSKKSTLW
jgi:hypothetical protein